MVELTEKEKGSQFEKRGMELADNTFYPVKLA